MISLFRYSIGCEDQAACPVVAPALREVCAANARIARAWRERVIEIASLLASDNRGVEREVAAQATAQLLALAGDDGEEG